MCKKIALVFVLVLFYGLTLVLAQEESMTFTTYYPAPYGVYHDLRTDGLSVGSVYRNRPLIADGLIVQGNVGIGTDTPMARLDVVGDLKADTNVFTNCGWFAFWAGATTLCPPSQLMIGIRDTTGDGIPDEIMCCNL